MEASPQRMLRPQSDFAWTGIEATKGFEQRDDMSDIKVTIKVIL